MLAVSLFTRGLRRYSTSRSLCSTEEASDLAGKIVKFADDAGEVSFGVFASAGEVAHDLWVVPCVTLLLSTSVCIATDEKHAFRVGLGDDGKMKVSNDPVKIAAFLPPVDAVSVFGIGLNYKKHAAETKSELPKNPGECARLGLGCGDVLSKFGFAVLFMKSISSLTGHQSPIVIPRIAQSKPEVRRMSL
jgi:hypothetical protein